MNLNLWKSMAIWVNERSQVKILWGAVDGSASSQRMVINGHWVGKKVTSQDLRARWMDRHTSVTGPVRARGRAAANVTKSYLEKRRHQAQIRPD